ncbi:hypothetical protein [Bacteroides faecichinchillae]|uniref:hypothetical protein n=1 Tax=Bacteroides faecichinchillae TaxID=871325 RepID=UPI0015879B8E|nr:hypothetical protein [Bacteroides faecichinchillae]
MGKVFESPHQAEHLQAFFGQYGFGRVNTFQLFLFRIKPFQGIKHLLCGKVLPFIFLISFLVCRKGMQFKHGEVEHCFKRPVCLFPTFRRLFFFLYGTLYVAIFYIDKGCRSQHQPYQQKIPHKDLHVQPLWGLVVIFYLHLCLSLSILGCKVTYFFAFETYIYSINLPKNIKIEYFLPIQCFIYVVLAGIHVISLFHHMHA